MCLKRHLGIALLYEILNEVQETNFYFISIRIIWLKFSNFGATPS